MTETKQTFRYFLYLQYNGTAYKGWQVQPGSPTIQDELQKAFAVLLKSETMVIGAGRTDAGVHASYYVAHFDTDTSIEDSEKLVYKLNSILPSDIAISSIARVKADARLHDGMAHARYSAIYRTYKYIISTKKDPFNVKLRAKIFEKFDILLMNKAANYILDYKDFTSFSKLHTDTKTNICKVEFAKWTAVDDRLIFEIRADRFLRNMVRAIVGTLLDIGRGKLNPVDIRAIIEQQDRAKAGKSVEPYGLYLSYIEYPNNIFM